MAHRVESRFDETDNTFVPPLRTLGFNQNLTMNDSLLVQSYIECYDISYPEALRRIEDEVDELCQHLQTEGVYELTDIGELKLNDEGNIEFKPCEAGILTPGLYGLGTFEMCPLNAVEESENTVVEVPAEPVQQQTNLREETTDEETEEKTEEPSIVIKMSWLRNAVAVAAAILAFFMIGTPVSNSNMESQTGVQQSSFIPINAQSATSDVIDTEETAPAQEVDVLAVNEEAPGENTESEASVAIAEKVQKDEYCIVLASQVSQKNADGFVEQLVQQGFNDAYITNKRFRRVVYGHYSSKDEAMSRLKELRAQSRKNFAEGWVMKVED